MKTPFLIVEVTGLYLEEQDHFQSRKYEILSPSKTQNNIYDMLVIFDNESKQWLFCTFSVVYVLLSRTKT